ncbi:TonB-dependent receptor [Helicobacter sp. 13S00477-4]|uniref:TonB-dependent receptor n=1 Tax=Helicobacter sp. 13S00477-4 TaxID=1905759 RepID=UPI000BA7E4D0|nr:TonB-dependent receptor [Helicobacter sp. 13S00477-4]PAF52789.1 hypothetical protein BKH44_00990 [Helicobacter sp. 13S00477-4]
MTKQNSFKKFNLGFLMLSSLLFADNPSTSPPPDNDFNDFIESKNSYQLKSITTTSNKIEELAFQSDSSLSIATGKELDKLGITNTQELGKVFSGLIITSSGNIGYPSVTLRGIHAGYYYSPSIRLYVDGIPQDMAFINQSLIDVERVELLRGPQSTLYGENAQAGILNIITNTSKTNTPKTNIRTNFSLLKQNALITISTPIIKDWLYMRGNLEKSYFSGQIKQKITGLKVDTYNMLLGNITLLLEPKNHPFYASLNYSADDVKTHDSIYLNPTEFKDLVFSGFVPFVQRRVDTYALKLGYRFENIDFYNVFSFQRRNLYQDTQWGDWYEKQNQITDELRFVKKYQNGSNSIVGFYFSNANFHHQTPDTLKNFPDGKLNGASNHLITNQYAIFNENKISFLKVFDFTFGLRYQYGTSDINYTVEHPLQKGFDSFKGFYQYQRLIPKIALGYQINDDNRVYVSFSEGFKPGGFPNAIFSEAYKNHFNPEISYNGEIGYKAFFFGDKLSLQAAYYYIYITDRQEPAGIAGGKITLTNLGNAQSTGLELNVSYNPIESLLFSLNTNIGNSRFKNSYDPITKLDITNNYLTFAPDVSLNANVDYNFYSLSNLKFYANLNLQYYSTTYFDNQNFVKQNPYALFDASLRLEMKNIQIRLYGNNLGNYKHYRYAYNFGEGKPYYSQLQNLRNIGIELGIKL